MIDVADTEAKRGALWVEQMPSGCTYKITKTMRKCNKGRATLLLHATADGGKTVQVTQIVLPPECNGDDLDKGLEIGKQIAGLWDSGERDKDGIQKKKETLMDEFSLSKPSEVPKTDQDSAEPNRRRR